MSGKTRGELSVPLVEPFWPQAKFISKFLYAAGLNHVDVAANGHDALQYIQTRCSGTGGR